MHLRRIAGMLLAITALLVLPSLTAAHAQLESSHPEAGAELDEPPTEVSLTFDDELEPAGSSFTVTDEDGAEVGSGEVDLDVAERNVMRGAVQISDPGSYTVSWEVTAADGHADSGEFTFGYRSEAAAAENGSDEESAPDTALGSTGASPLVLVGVVLLLCSVAPAATRRLIAV